jgi:hypothetical protein
MKLLITADLHLVHPGREHVLAQLKTWREQYHPDGLIVAGDLAVAAQADSTLKDLRACFADGPIMICLGNHDFWVSDIRQYNDLDAVIERHWLPAARRHRVELLDDANAELDGITICGGYGHYDLGFAIPDLSYDGVNVGKGHYLSGKPPIDTLLRWRDFDFMPGSKDLIGLAEQQVRAIERRLSLAKSPILAVVHVPPFEMISGLPSRNGVIKDPSIYAFFRAYLGNVRLGDLLRRHESRLVAIVCGHTHRKASPIDLGGFLGLNVGSDYGKPRGWLYETVSKEVGKLRELR